MWVDEYGFEIFDPTPDSLKSTDKWVEDNKREPVKKIEEQSKKPKNNYLF